MKTQPLKGVITQLTPRHAPASGTLGSLSGPGPRMLNNTDFFLVCVCVCFCVVVLNWSSSRRMWQQAKHKNQTIKELFFPQLFRDLWFFSSDCSFYTSSSSKQPRQVALNMAAAHLGAVESLFAEGGKKSCIRIIEGAKYCHRCSVKCLQLRETPAERLAGVNIISPHPPPLPLSGSFQILTLWDNTDLTTP